MSRPTSQAGQPRGLVGRLLGWIMVRHNAPDNAWTLDQLDIQAGDHILQDGFGPGAAIAVISGRYPAVRISGIDHARTMLEAASVRNREAIAAGKLDLQLGSVTRLPFADASFDKVFAINSIYFWEPLQQGLSELQRVLKPGGCLAVTVRDKQRAPYPDFRPDKLIPLFRQAGFSCVDTRRNGIPGHPLICLLGIK
jgi:ubiquinone/menaquinone biosynthesis C-methylase UbiE